MAQSELQLRCCLSLQAALVLKALQRFSLRLVRCSNNSGVIQIRALTCVKLFTDSK